MEGAGDVPVALSFHCSFCCNEVLQCLHCDYSLKMKSRSVQHFKKNHCLSHEHQVTSDNNDDDEGDATIMMTSDDREGDNDDASVANNEEDTVSVQSNDDSDIINDMFELDISQCSDFNGSDNGMDDGMDIDEDMDMEVTEGTLTIQTLKRLSKFEEVFCRNSKAAIYFCHQAQLFGSGIMTGGLQGIVHRCIAQQRTYELSDLETAKRYFLLLKLLHSVAGSLKQIVMDHTCSVIDMMIPNRQPNIPLPNFPKTIEDAHKAITGPKHAMASNLPIERTINVDDNHAYVSVDTCIDTMLAHGIRPCFAQDEHGTRNTEGLNGCPFVEERLNYIRSIIPNPDSTAIGWVSLWSDGFLTSYVKQRTNSAWLLTLTVSEPSGKRSKDHTHILAMGPSKSASHSDVVLYALNEVVGLLKVKKRYCGKTNQWIDTVFFLIFYLADRPERNELTYTSQLGTFTKRFMWAAYTDRSTLPSCQHCYMRRIKVLLGIISRSQGATHCSSCCDWNFNTPNSEGWKNSSSDLGKIFGINSSSREPNYPNSTSNTDLCQCVTTPFPESRRLPEISHIRPIQQNFDDLKKAVVLAFQQVASGSWFRYNFNTYLRGCGVNEHARNQAYTAAREANKELKLILSMEARTSRLAEMLNDKYLLSKGALPAMWCVEGLTLNQFPEVPMHLLFTGNRCLSRSSLLQR